MKTHTPYPIPYTLALCLLLLIGCAQLSEDREYAYCVLEEQQMCISGTFKSSDCNGELSNGCRYSSSKKCESIFNPSTHFCYDSNVYSKCDSMVYNPTNSICQGGIASPAKCGNSSYNPLERSCCASTIYNPLERSCCASTIYNPLEQSCCVAAVFNLGSQRCQNDVVESLCGGTGGNYNYHNPLTQFCNGNEVLNKCGGKNYTPANQKCEDDVVLTKCGTEEWYNSANQRCQSNVIETRCGTNGWYDSENENFRCQNDVVESKCGTGNNFHNPLAQFCNGNEVLNRCGKDKRDYDPATQRCMNDVIETKCGTGNSFYNSATQFCNGNSVYDKCSGYIEYNPTAQFCNKNSVYDKCNGLVYAPANQRCENKVVETRCGDNGSYYYDATSANFRCRNDVVETKCGTNGWYNARNSSVRCQDNVVENQCGSAWHNPSTQFCNVNQVFNKCGGNIYDPYTQECVGGSVRTATYSGTFTDSRNSKTYKWIRIGTQKWMAENLNYSGTEPDAVGKCYDNEEGNCDTYGRLYDWATAMAVCPSGWHLPSDAEWTTLVNYVENNVCSGCASKHLKAASGWNDCGPFGSGNSYLCEDTYGFSALPGGTGYSGGSFGYVGDNGYWWSASEASSSNTYNRVMYYYLEDAYSYNYGKSYLHSVRCMED